MGKTVLMVKWSRPMWRESRNPSLTTNARAYVLESQNTESCKSSDLTQKPRKMFIQLFTYGKLKVKIKCKNTKIQTLCSQIKMK